MSWYRIAPRFPSILVSRFARWWTGPAPRPGAGPRAVMALAVAGILILPLPAAHAAAITVVGSGSTTKAGQHESIRFVILNTGAAPARVSGTLAPLPVGFALTTEAPGTRLVEPGTVAVMEAGIQVAFGTPDGFHDITFNWADDVSGESGAAAARVLLTPYDTYSPTLSVVPDPLLLVGEAAGSSRGLAGCLTDNNGTLVPWFITECPFVFRTRVEQPGTGAAGRVVVTPLSGVLDIPEGAPTEIPLSVTAPAEAGALGLDVVTIEIDALTPAGWRRTAAWCRFAVAWSRPTARLLTVRTGTWGDIKSQYAQRGPR